jgi:hypothetical protein
LTEGKEKPMKQTGVVMVTIPVEETVLIHAFDGMVKNLPTQFADGIVVRPGSGEAGSENFYILPINELESLGALVRLDITVDGQSCSIFVPVDRIRFALIGGNLSKLGFVPKALASGA